MTSKSSSLQVLKRLREEYEQQTRTQKQILQSENEFFKNAKNMENQRHNESMIQMEQDQARRIQVVKQQEAEYIKQISDIRSKYATEKRKIERKHQHDIRMLEESRFPVDDCDDRIYEPPEMIPDAVYAEALVTELLKLQNKRTDPLKHDRKRTRNKKIQLLSSVIDSHINLLHSVLNRSRY